jgi:hypothetical protein
VVVSEAEVAKQLIDRGQLANRTQFIPLDKINPYPTDRRKLEAARNIVCFFL